MGKEDPRFWRNQSGIEKCSIFLFRGRFLFINTLSRAFAYHAKNGRPEKTTGASIFSVQNHWKPLGRARDCSVNPFGTAKRLKRKARFFAKQKRRT
ncbi:MAG: hypothetical protein LBQ57_07770, partial [Spirochaetales bacterium]|nr:hypothetical protein [Spirochaetales bacterium]